MASNVNVTSKGIQKILSNYNPKFSLAEYIWNGFDAKADTVHIKYDANELGRLDYIEVSDNGYGINFENLTSKFNPFYESEKAVEISTPKNISTMHGKNGVGRLTFFTFAHAAEWLTTFKKKNTFISGKISIDVSALNKYVAEPLEEKLDDKTGTKVTFTNLIISKEELEISVIPYLISEFCWFLELNKQKNFAIIINGQALDYSSNIEDIEEGEVKYDGSNDVFYFKYIQWKESLHKELSKYYYLDGTGKEQYKDYTTLNKKSDQFYHSVYIKSRFFDDFDFKTLEINNQISLFGKNKFDLEYKFLIKYINHFLITKRKPYLKEIAERLIEEYVASGVFPTYKTDWETTYKKPQLENTIIALYEAQPKLFSSLNIGQKKTFVRLLDLLLDSNERDNLFSVIEQVEELDVEEKEDLSKLFKTTQLNSTIQTIKLIEERNKIYNHLKDLLSSKHLKATEFIHLQKLIENNFWIFGEQYHLATAIEPKFDEVLRNHVFNLNKLGKSIKTTSAQSLKEVDIFTCRQNILADRIENIIIEIKHPSVSLGEEHYAQVLIYLEAIAAQPHLNAGNTYWEFYLVGTEFNASNYMEGLIGTNKKQKTPSLILSKDNGKIKVYAKKWNDVFTNFETKYNYLDKKLKQERDQLTNEITTAKEVVVA